MSSVLTGAGNILQLQNPPSTTSVSINSSLLAERSRTRTGRRFEHLKSRTGGSTVHMTGTQTVKAKNIPSTPQKSSIEMLPLGPDFTGIFPDRTQKKSKTTISNPIQTHITSTALKSDNLSFRSFKSNHSNPNMPKQIIVSSPVHLAPSTAVPPSGITTPKPFISTQRIVENIYHTTNNDQKAKRPAPKLSRILQLLPNEDVPSTTLHPFLQDTFSEKSTNYRPIGQSSFGEPFDIPFLIENKMRRRLNFVKFLSHPLEPKKLAGVSNDSEERLLQFDRNRSVGSAMFCDKNERPECDEDKANFCLDDPYYPR